VLNLCRVKLRDQERLERVAPVGTAQYPIRETADEDSRRRPARGTPAAWRQPPPPGCAQVQRLETDPTPTLLTIQGSNWKRSRRCPLGIRNGRRSELRHGLMRDSHTSSIIFAEIEKFLANKPSTRAVDYFTSRGPCSRCCPHEGKSNTTSFCRDRPAIGEVPHTVAPGSYWDRRLPDEVFRLCFFFVSSARDQRATSWASTTDEVL